MNLDALLRIKADVQGENNIRRLGNSMQGVQGKVKNLQTAVGGLTGALKGLAAGLAVGAFTAFGIAGTFQLPASSLPKLQNQQQVPPQARQHPSLLHHPVSRPERCRQPNAQRPRLVFSLGSLQAAEVCRDDCSGKHRHIQQLRQCAMAEGHIFAGVIRNARPTHQHLSGQLAIRDLARFDLSADFTNARLAQAPKLTIETLAFMPAAINREIKGDRPGVAIGLLENECHQVRTRVSSSLPAVVGVAT